MTQIMSISRMRYNTDGEGICTHVAFFGCPLSCKYCLNPQCSQNTTPCITITPSELMQIVQKDSIYFKKTNGGITFGGGEPLMQSSFIQEFCKLNKNKWNIRLQTTLNVNWKYIEPLIEQIAMWYIDIKDMNPDIYQKYTGLSNQQVIHNLQKLSQLIDKQRICIRVPIIPKFNTEEDIQKSILALSDITDNFDVFTYHINQLSI